MRLPSFADVKAAEGRLRPHVFVTPLLRSPVLDERVGGRLLFKAECLQLTGSFKVRGAFNRLLLLSDAERRAGVVAWSAGNHGQAVAYAGRELGVNVTIVMPSFAPKVKIEGTRRWDANIVLYDDESANREEIGLDLARRTGAVPVPPFDDPDVVAGQGTVALEAIRSARSLGLDPDRIFCGTGGGGLAAGCALAAEGIGSKARIHPVEPEGNDDTSRSLIAGKRVSNHLRVPSICDALVTRSPGKIPFLVNRDRLAPGIVISELQTKAAVKIALMELKLVVEPGGVAALAAALSRPDLVSNMTTLVVLSGGNVDPSALIEMIR